MKATLSITDCYRDDSTTRKTGDPPCPVSTSLPNKTTSTKNCKSVSAEALYDVDSIVADPGAYTREELASLHSQIVPNLERAWEIAGGSEDQLLPTMMQMSQVVARKFKMEK